jgi:hypothetical protein
MCVKSCQGTMGTHLIFSAFSTNGFVSWSCHAAEPCLQLGCHDVHDHELCSIPSISCLTWNRACLT